MKDSSSRYNLLRNQHPVLVYEKAGYEIKENEIEFWAEFKLEPDITFRPQVSITLPSDRTGLSLDDTALRQFAFVLGLAEIPSYWKATLSPLIEIKAGAFHRNLDMWLNELLINGLSEFYFVNQIDQFKDPTFVSITWSQPNTATVKPVLDQVSPLRQTLLPLGGGKDSLVALKLLQNFGLSNDSLGILVLSPASPAASTLAQEFGLPVITAKRVIDPQLLALNNDGYWNGHTPFSAYLSVLSSCAGYIFDFSHVALGNERSANEGNISFHGLEVNHQWSKSFEYERLFQAVSTTALPAETPEYFSLLRPLYELQIAGLFADFYSQNQNVLSTFRSCNRGQRTNSWCLNCPKCLFAFIILSPFLPPGQLADIFGADLWQAERMLPILGDLLGHGTNKPLECVGMYEETLVASYLARRRYYGHGNLPLLLRHLEDTVFPQETDLGQRALELLDGWNAKNLLPSDLDQFVLDTIQTSPSLKGAKP